MSASVLTSLVGVLGAAVGGLAAFAGVWWHARAVAQSRYQQAWRGLTDALAAVQIAGPTSLSAAGAALHDAATSYGVAVDARLEGGRGTAAPGHDLERRLGEARGSFARPPPTPPAPPPRPP